MLSIKTRIILAYTVVFGVLIAVFAFYIYQGTKETETARVDARLEAHAAKIISELEEESDSSEPVEVRKILSIPPEGLSGLRVQLYEPSGALLVADTLIARHASGLWKEAVRGKEEHEVFTVDGQEYRCLWVPIELNDKYPAAVELAASMQEADATLAKLRLMFFGGIPLALLLTAFTAYLITRYAFRPIMSMVETARQITARNLDRRIPLPPAQDEVRLLGETLNGMVERIDAAFRSQRQFVADASHEIRTPLTVVCSELEFIGSQNLDPAALESVRTSLAEIDRLAKLTDSLLLLARLDASQLSLNMQPVRLDELLVDSVQLIRSIADKNNIQIRVHLEDALEVRADREKLKSVIINLLENAVKYSSPGSVVCVSLEQTNSTALLSVEDHGCGIPQEAILNIFRRFYRVDPARTERPGSGLGLAIVERLVELHGGRITVKSTVGQGSTFTVELPMTGAPVAS